MNATENLPSNSKLARGTVLDRRYKITGVLGQGGSATVYSAVQVRVRRQVAVKVLALEGGGDQRIIVERFLREARAAASLQHPNTVTVHDVGVLPSGQPYIVMETFAGRTLKREVIKNGPVVPERALGLFLGALDALAKAHSSGIIHRDLKPSNLVLVNPGERIEMLKIIDFGIARLRDEKVDLTGSQILGTPAYLSPEYIKDHVVTPALDVYQMGLVLVEMLTGNKVVKGATAYQCLFAHISGQLDIPDSLKQGLIGDVICRAVAFDHTERFVDAAAFRNALEQIDPRELTGVGDCWRAPESGEESVEDVSFNTNDTSLLEASAQAAMAMMDEAASSHKYKKAQDWADDDGPQEFVALPDLEPVQEALPTPVAPSGVHQGPLIMTSVPVPTGITNEFPTIDSRSNAGAPSLESLFEMVQYQPAEARPVLEEAPLVFEHPSLHSLAPPSAASVMSYDVFSGSGLIYPGERRSLLGESNPLVVGLLAAVLLMLIALTAVLIIGLFGPWTTSSARSVAPIATNKIQAEAKPAPRPKEAPVPASHAVAPAPEESEPSAPVLGGVPEAPERVVAEPEVKAEQLPIIPEEPEPPKAISEPPAEETSIPGAAPIAPPKAARKAPRPSTRSVATAVRVRGRAVRPVTRRVDDAPAKKLVERPHIGLVDEFTRERSAHRPHIGILDEQMKPRVGMLD